MKIQRVERHNICRGHPMWRDCDLAIKQHGYESWYNEEHLTMWGC